MKQNLKKIAAILLSLLMLAGAFSTLVITASADESDSLFRGEFTFAPHTYTDGDLTDIYYYTDDVFRGTAVVYNEHLATMSMILASASISSQDSDATYDVKSRNLEHLLIQWGFESFRVNEYYEQRPSEQTMGVGMAYKVVGEGDDAYTLLAIVPRSAGYEKEWTGNFTVGKEGLHEGFCTGRDIILDFAKQYLSVYSDSFVGEVKIWTVGYSRGAGVANLLAAYLDDNSEALGFELKKENIFAYTFGTPSNVQYTSAAEKEALEMNYLNIHNSYADYDIVTYAPFKNWDFTYYGTTKLFDVYNAEKKMRMLSFLSKTNPTIYDIYTADNSTADPDNFAPVMIKADKGENGLAVEIIPADPEYGIPTNQRDFLESRIAYLAKQLVPDRVTYVDGGYQHALQRMTSLFFGLDDEQTSLLISGMSQDVKTLAAAYYCYYLADCYLASEQTAADAVLALLDSLAFLELYVVLMEPEDMSEAPAWYQFASEFLASEEYAKITGLLEAIVANPESIHTHVVVIHDTLKAFAVALTGTVLEGGIEALTIDENEKTALMTTMTSTDVTVPLTNFLVYLLLGDEDGVVAPFNPSNKNVALAVTFLTNAGRYMRVHNNEIILSWLRTEDSYYENENWHIHSTDIAFDENGHWFECACGYKEVSCAHVLSDWRTIPVENAEGEMVLTRSCPCGYEESKPVAEEGDNALVGTMTNTVGTTTIVLICVGAAVIVAAVVAMIVISNKRKSKK